MIFYAHYFAAGSDPELSGLRAISTCQDDCVPSRLEQHLRELIKTTSFSGVVRVEREGESVIDVAAGFADRANERPNTLDTRFGVASGTKGFTALTIMSLVEDGTLSLDTPVAAIVGDQLPVIAPAVTVDHLLSHRSGIGDYLDEETLGDIDDYVFAARSTHTLATPAAYLDLLNAHPQRTPPGTEFVYNNSGYVVLSHIIETLTGSFHHAVHDRVLQPAAMARSGFFRSDQLPEQTALGYLADGRTNVFHLPILGAGDGGIYLTLDDSAAFWSALASGKIVSPSTVAVMTSIVTDRGDRPSYGRGFWLGDGQHVWLEGMDAGVSFQTGIDRASGATYTVISNTSAGAWPVIELILSKQ